MKVRDVRRGAQDHAVAAGSAEIGNQAEHFVHCECVELDSSSELRKELFNSRGQRQYSPKGGEVGRAAHDHARLNRGRQPLGAPRAGWLVPVVAADEHGAIGVDVSHGACAQPIIALPPTAAKGQRREVSNSRGARGEG